MTAQSENTNIRTLSLSFDLPIAHRQLPQWRGAFAELAGVENDLFHNHKNAFQLEMPDAGYQMPDALQRSNSAYSFVPQPENEAYSAISQVKSTGQNQTDTESLHSPIPPSPYSPIPPSPHPPTYHYRYPLIQYRAQKGNASIFAINEGIEAVQGVLSSRNWQINWEGAPRPLLITGMQMQEYDLRLLPRPKAYQLYRWLALNEENYARWQQCDSLVARITLLERILASQILAFAGSVGWRVPERVEVRLQNLGATQKVYCHGMPLLAFDVSYTANVLLPPHIALGKGVSHGFGWQVPQTVGNNQRQRRLQTEGLTLRSE